MDIYQETYEKIQDIISKDRSQKEDPQLDMYADDFDEKEKKCINGKNQRTSQSQTDEKSTELKWEFKWNQDNDEISGPHSTEQMHKWSTDGYFKSGVWVRKRGEDSQFYNSNRIDFELYMQLLVYKIYYVKVTIVLVSIFNLLYYIAIY